MGPKSSSLLLLTFLVIFSVSLANLNPASAKETKLAQAVYITTSLACGCILDRCQAGDWVVEKTFVGDKKLLLKRIDFTTQRDLAKEYISKYRLAIPPALLFLDNQGNLLWRTDGELDLDVITQKLKEFGA